MRVRKTGGGTALMEVCLFADLAPDGRFHRINETTLLLDGAEADRGLGGAR